MRFLKTFLLRLTVCSLSLGILGGAFLLVALYFFGSDLPDCQKLSVYRPPVVTRLYSADGHLFQEYAHEKRVFVPIQAIPKRVIQAFLAAEDKNFYAHHGVDFLSLARAVILNVVNAGVQKRPQGASTITQQVAKNFFLDSEVSYLRKVKEAILAFRIEQTLSKDRILELYLNQIYLGIGSYGVAAASLKYFNKSLNELSIAETAFLAGLPKAPSRYHPARDPDAAMRRRDWVLQRMLEEHVIHEREMEMARITELRLYKPTDQEGVSADYFAEEVRRFLAKNYGPNTLYEGGLTVKTTLDPVVQSYAEQALREGLVAYDRRHGYRGPLGHLEIKDLSTDSMRDGLKKFKKPAGLGSWHVAVVTRVTDQEARIILYEGTGVIPLSEVTWARKALSEGSLGPVITSVKEVLHPGDVVAVHAAPSGYQLCQIPIVGGALVAMDPHTGRVLALQGGYDFSLSSFNRATQALRQPGSAFKPFVYLTALEKGLSPTYIIQDSPLSIELGGNLGVWKPRNVDDRYWGPRTLRAGLEHSRNLMTIRLAQIVGMANIKKTAETFGVVNQVPLQLAMVLGAGETTVLRMTTAFGTIANGGHQIQPILIDRIQDRDGRTLYRSDQRHFEACAPKTCAFPSLQDDRPLLSDPQSLYQLTSMLQGVIDRGTGRRVQGLGRPVAGKTGSTNQWRDAWFVGFTPDIVVAVFVGFDDSRSLGSKETGGAVASPIFAHFMRLWGSARPAVPFKIPPGLKMMRVDPLTGAPSKRPDALFEVFKPHQHPNGLQQQPHSQGSSTKPESAPSSPPSIEQALEEGIY